MGANPQLELGANQMKDMGRVDQFRRVAQFLEDTKEFQIQRGRDGAQFARVVCRAVGFSESRGDE